MQTQARRSSPRSAKANRVLTRTFCHVPGVGRETESALWQQGCDCWETLLADPDKFSFGHAKKADVLQHIADSKAALDEGNHQFFRKSLGQAEAWRAWPEFRDKCVYLDIETDGGNGGHSVTIIGLYDANGFQALVRGSDLDTFHDIITQYSYIVTFFGSMFDIPMLQRRFPMVTFDQIHLDLCFALKRLGYGGGLKKIERQLGIARADGVVGMSGLDAVRLWAAYTRGHTDALDRLIAYNREDVVNLEFLAQVAYDGHKRALLSSAN